MGDPSATTVGQVMVLAGNQENTSFDPEVHSAWAVNAPAPDLVKGSLVKLTGLVSGEALNGVVGQILSVNDGRSLMEEVRGEKAAHPGDATYDVITPSGQYRVTYDNVIPKSATVVSRNPAQLVGLDTLLVDLGHQIRLLWLEKADPKPLKPPRHGVCQAIKTQYFAMDTDGDHQVSAGEFRNFLWNLHLSDQQFETVMQRFSPAHSTSRADYLDLEMMLFLLGRPHILAPEVPIDALLYEAVVSILGRRTTAHIDKDLSQEDSGVGHRAACKKHCCSYTISFMLAWIARLSLGAVVVSLAENSPSQDLQAFLGIFAVSYCLYLVQVFCASRMATAFQNETYGIDRIMEAMERPHHENPYYRWHVECYHFVTVVYYETVRRQDGTTRQERRTRREKRVTHVATTCGVIPSTDCSNPFIPQTTARQTQINTSLLCDFSHSNYLSRYDSWCLFHRTDVHQDATRHEDLHSRMTSCLAVWVAKPWWMRKGYFICTTVCLMSCTYRWLAQARMGEQSYCYVKRCYSI